MEKLLNNLALLGRKPRGREDLPRPCKVRDWEYKIDFEEETYSFRDLVGKESWFRQFLCEREFVPLGAHYITGTFEVIDYSFEYYITETAKLHIADLYDFISEIIYTNAIEKEVNRLISKPKDSKLNKELREENKRLNDENEKLKKKNSTLEKELKARLEQIENLQDSYKKIQEEHNNCENKSTTPEEPWQWIDDLRKLYTP